MTTELIRSVVFWFFTGAWVPLNAGLDPGPFVAYFVSTDTLWPIVLAPMNIVTQRDAAILKSLRKRYQKAFELDDREATQQLFKEATYLGISLEQLVDHF